MSIQWSMRWLVVAMSLLLALPLPAVAAQTSEQQAPVMATSSVATGEAGEQHPSAASMAADAVLVRPLGVAATAIGAALFVVSLPFTAIAGNVGEAGHALVVAPARMTFDRPLGHFKQR